MIVLTSNSRHSHGAENRPAPVVIFFDWEVNMKIKRYIALLLIALAFVLPTVGCDGVQGRIIDNTICAGYDDSQCSYGD